MARKKEPSPAELKRRRREAARRVLEVFGIDPEGPACSSERAARYQAAFRKTCVLQYETIHTDATGRQWHGVSLN